ncbi:hypothetical protein [Metabacillus fastidiosus]|uniref:hypothetical protein n=1 Tax=Metabacillus fastidiosus TaxID=1458 RepID=UPI000826B03C|nr:hypothetical protein [Metabacillus fastidiosus]
MTKELSIFDMGVEDDLKKEEKEVTKKASTSSTNKPKTQPKPQEETKVTGEWTIHFATETFEVRDFVEEEDIPAEGISLETLRAEMEKVYFQFTASRTYWDVEEDNKRLFPEASGASKGAF